ncbi:PTS system beta-glucoside-specific IIA component, Glc family /PTS system beta-glucoside-specific IIB component, Glc family /PTS system beta-glucoside-specific IIC component, Glc family [Pasteurella testudinis DSM 23072]|uniref:PTS system beta-glucoside-specific IIA component, Glc family /PTS system beta-glucoside-specific IIB component, Glc family /PTS system beta-glucoside-specific IIC component, Glc family n=1 Tax=Pasteurella testudinis DSM 23072 TaxID=1122938 RepID=A0A1W1UF81_9PAST|nr:beta-glucoside-specific PTS transporter subunit IIABC [Pasteurella testudinis]SMB79461.1 PTS system beta-glucoside-specific IIA component, Glc family /PTS system beta-glucoside-specific IIB component, Glc family /PTS system beta-glucoside-specific IIC component, Glc family [Pasteurella testudinis DSM 23072]SUB50761.1 PTS system sucrose-specific transporter subunit IIBC [Pasteurella testudinis]
MAKDFSKLASEIVCLVGGEQNIHSVVHCATRLRFVLKDQAAADKVRLNQTAGVISVIESGGQFQVVIGNNVSKVYAEIVKQTDIQQGNAADLPKPSLLNRAIDFLASTFTPLIGVMAGAGILKGLVALLTISGLFAADSGTLLVLDATASSTFYFLPILLAITAAKKMCTNPYIAVAVAAALVYPTIVSATASGNPIDFLGIELSLMTYTYSVLPILLAVWLQSYVLRFFEQILHETVRTFFAPALTLLVVVPLTFLVIGPIGAGFGNVLAAGLSWLYQSSPILTGIVVGALWQVLVIFGLHWSIAPIIINNMAVIGFDVLLPMTGAAVLGQVGATVGVLLKTHNKELKSLAGSTAFSGFLCVTEPLIYGVTLRFKKPFICGVIGGAIGGAVMAVGGTKAFAFGFSGLLAYPVLIGPGSNLLAYSLGMLVALISAAILTYGFGFKDTMLAPAAEQTAANAESAVTAQHTSSARPPLSGLQLVSPLKGEIHRLNSIDDPLFSSESLGKGVAILPSAGELSAPVSGTIISVFPTKHAITIESDDGLQVLIHVGMDTVQLNGRYFEQLVQEGDHVSAGQPLLTFDLAKIKQAGYSLMTPIIINNSEDYLDIIATQAPHIEQGQPLLSVILNQSGEDDKINP